MKRTKINQERNGITEKLMMKPFDQQQADCEEAALIRAARDDPQAFGLLYQRYVKRVYGYLYSRLGNVQDAEETTAETFLSAFRAFHNFRQEKNFPAWLFTIARNKVIDYYRRQPAQPPSHATENLSDGVRQEERVIVKEEMTKLSGLVSSLPEEDQELLRLRYLAGLSFPQMARTLRRGTSAVKKSVYRLLARLKGQMEVSNE